MTHSTEGRSRHRASLSAGASSAPAQPHLLKNAKRYTYIAATCFSIINAAIPIVLLTLGSSVYSQSAIYVNSITIAVCLVFVTLLVLGKGIKAVEIALMITSCGYVFTWDVINLTIVETPNQINSYRHVTMLIGCAIAAVAFPRKTGLTCVVGFLVTHIGLMWAKLLTQPWSDFHYYQIDDTVMSLVLGSLIALTTMYQFSLGKSATMTSGIKESELFDPLTGLPSRRNTVRTLKELGPCSIVTINIDNFTHLNSEKGVSFGDSTLQDFANYLVNVFPGNSLVSRWDGNEFYVVVPNAPADYLITHVSLIRQELDTMVPDFPLTACCTISTKGDSEHYETLLARCDQLGMSAKAIGKDIILTDQAGSAADEVATANLQNTP